MSVVYSIEINAHASKIFALYTNIHSWPIWDSEVSAVHLPGLHLGVSGWLKPRQGPKSNIHVAEVVPNRSFTIESRLPLCRMQFGHELEGDENRTTVTHWVRFTGPLAFLFRQLIGKGIAQTLPKTLAGLKRASEAQGK
ncbi:SRPBCC family protein [Serratia sp. PAMC26656]|jgi:hypothetical protein|uniref:SRPBCC family protein n=1 Tax=Serratia sp. PAMC26656 TaxID=2775909 RepID=UPI0018F3EC9D|nr:SRPBCC family protein [Serratia sp. PAMC26656]MBJ7893572.1 SRPBCC family protein [Serratia sp. PAMC26656]